MDLELELEAILWACGIIATIGTAFGVLHKGYTSIKKPTVEIQEELDSQQRRIDRLEDSTDKLLKEVQKSRKLHTANCRSTLAMLDHLISGNHVDGLKTVRRSLQESITENE